MVPLSDEHVSPHNIRRLLGGNVDPADSAQMEAHVRDCLVCQRRFGAASMLTPHVTAWSVGLVAAVLAVLVVLCWSADEGAIGRWSVVEDPETAVASPAERLMATAGAGRLTLAEADAIVMLAALVQMEVELIPAVAGDAGERHTAITGGCAALQAGDAPGAADVLAMFETIYDATGSPVLAVASYVAGTDTDGTIRLLRQATADATRAASHNRMANRGAIWFLGRALIQSGDADGAREAWAWLAAEEHSGAFSRLAQAALASALTQ